MLNQSRGVCTQLCAHLEYMVIEVTLKLFVCQVDAKLLEAVRLQHPFIKFTCMYCTGNIWSGSYRVYTLRCYVAYLENFEAENIEDSDSVSLRDLCKVNNNSHKKRQTLAEFQVGVLKNDL